MEYSPGKPRDLKSKNILAWIESDGDEEWWDMIVPSFGGPMNDKDAERLHEWTGRYLCWREWKDRQRSLKEQRG